MDEIGGECSTHGRNAKFMRHFHEELNEKDNFKDLGVDGKIILKHIFSENSDRMWTECM
jgi:hypothetical protein